MATSPKKTEPQEGVVGAAVFLGGDNALAVPFSGLLAWKPDLRTAELTPSEWQAKLDEFLQSPCP